MAVRPGSRYEMATVLRVRDANGKPHQTLYMPPPFLEGGVAQYRQHIWRDDDRIDRMAASLFGDPMMWWAIADVNPEIFNWLDVATGTVIRLPIGGGV